MLISPKQNDPHQVLLNMCFAYDCFKLLYVYLNDGDKFWEC